MSIYGIVVLALVLAFLSFLGTALYRAIAIRINIIDYPDDRSSHSIPTPSGAGLVFVGITIGCIYLVISPTHGDWAKLSLLLSFSAVALLGAVDDSFDLSIILRLLLQLLFIVGVMAAINDMTGQRSFLGIGLGNQIFLSALVLISMLWLLNLYNFMDGIDGLATCEAIFIASTAGTFLFVVGNLELAFWMLILVSTLCGFLYWNISPAKLFMGDAGSSFLGFFFGSIALLSISTGDLSIYFWLIICALFITDATITILYRLTAGENIFQAHRTHAYQNATVLLRGHTPVVQLSVIINMLWLLPCATLSFFYEHLGFIWLAAAYLPLVALCVYMKAGRIQPELPHSL